MLRLKFILHWLWTTSLKLATLAILLMSGSILWAAMVFFWQSNAELSAAHGVLQQNSESEFMAIGSFMRGISYLTMIVTGATFVFHYRDFIFAYNEKFKTKASTNQSTSDTLMPQSHSSVRTFSAAPLASEPAVANASSVVFGLFRNGDKK